MNAPAGRAATYDDLLQVPENLVAEIIHGQLITHPRPAPRHAMASSALGDEPVSPFGKGRGDPGGWWILDAPEWHLGPHVLVPDLAGWRRVRHMLRARYRRPATSSGRRSGAASRATFT